MTEDQENGTVEFIPHDVGLSSQLARADEILPDTLQLIPIDGRPYFPVLVQPIVVDKEPWGPGIVRVAESAHKLLAMSYAPKRGEGVPQPEDIKTIGCVVRIHRLHEVKGKFQFIAQGIKRFRIREWVRREPPYIVRVEYFDSVPGDDANQLRAYAMSLIDVIKELMTLNPLYNEELKQYLNHFSPHDPGPLADFAAAITTADAAELQDILETIPLLARMEKVLLLITKELEVARLQAQINEQMQAQVSEQQKEFFLRQQLKAILSSERR